MRVIYSFFWISIILVLSACAATHNQINYYSLNLNSHYSASDVSGSTILPDRPRIVVGPVYLAKFLQHEGLVLQTSQSEIKIANHHRWAEPLAEAIVKLLVQKLNAKSDRYQFGRMIGKWGQNAAYNLRLEVDNFHAVDQSKVVISGRYWLHEKDQKIRIDQVFDISHTLTQDGYLHSVEKLKQAIDQLSDEMIISINQL